MPADLWWIVALLCLHGHWALLRPCRVELPVELAPGEREFWLRLLDAAVETRGARRGAAASAPGRSRSATGVRDWSRATPPAGERVALAFSGGRDSLLSLGLLLELGEHPLAVTTTAPMPLVVDHAAPRRRTALETVASRPDVDWVEVRSNLRECWDNDFARRRGYELAVADLSDPMLYLAAALAIGWNRGASRILLGSAAELQTTDEADGDLMRHPRFAGAAIVLRRAGSPPAPAGRRRSARSHTRCTPGRSATCSGRATRSWLGFSTHAGATSRARARAAAAASASASALAALAAGVGPARAGVDVTELMERVSKWQPQLDEAALPRGDRPARAPRRGRPRARGDPNPPLRRRAGARRAGPAAAAATGRGRCGGTWRSAVGSAPGRPTSPPRATGTPTCSSSTSAGARRVERLFDSEFERAPSGRDAADLVRARALIERISEPLR